MQKQFFGYSLLGEMSTETIINCFQKRWVWTRICQHHFQQMKNLKSLFTQLREDDEITVEDFVTFDDNLTTSSGQINANLIDWRQQAQEEAIKEVVPDTSSASQTVKMVMKMIRRKTLLGALLYQKHFNTSMICFIFPWWKTMQHSQADCKSHRQSPK